MGLSSSTRKLTLKDVYFRPLNAARKSTNMLIIRKPSAIVLKSNRLKGIVDLSGSPRITASARSAFGSIKK